MQFKKTCSSVSRSQHTFINSTFRLPTRETGSEETRKRDPISKEKNRKPENEMHNRKEQTEKEKEEMSNERHNEKQTQ